MDNSIKKIFITPRAKARAKGRNVPIDQVIGSGPGGRIIEQDVLYFLESSDFQSATETSLLELVKKVTPLAKKIAKKENVDLHNIQGSGQNGKIKSLDVLSAINPKKTGKKEVPLTGIRKIIATRMSESKRTAPHVTLTVKTEATKFVQYRKSLMEKHSNLKISYTDLLLKIVADALKDNPKINVSLEEEKLIYHNDLNIGVAVALEDGLVVPIIQNVDKKSIEQIVDVVKDKVNRARNGKLKEPDFQNGRFTISNLGMYEVDAFTPVINQPESAILGVGRIIEDIIVQNEQIHIGKSMALSLSFDHRVMDGAPAAIFLGHIKRLIENPEEINLSEA